LAGAAFAQHRTTWEPPRDRAVRAAWTRGGGRCYSLASASVDSLLVHPLSPGRNVFRPEAEHVCLLDGVLRRPGCWPSARPLFMSALVEPSRDASQPLAPHVATRHQRVGSCSDRQLRPRALLSSARGPFHRMTRIVPPSPRFRGAISSVARRWRNDSRRLPSCRILCLPPQIHTAFQPRTPDASRRRTESLVVPSLLRSSATPAHRFARVPGVAPAPLRRAPGALRHLASTAPRRSSGLGMSRLPSVSADRAACDGLTRPPAACLATVRGARARCIRPTSASHSLSTTSTRAAFVPSTSSKLALRPFVLGLHPGRRRLGDLTVQDVRSASAGDLGFSFARRFFRALPTPPYLWHPCRLPVALAPLARSANPPSQPRPWLQAVREDPPATTIQDAFHRQPPAPCAGRTHSRKRSREGFRCDEGASVSSPAAAYSRTLELRARRPSLNASRSGEMEVRPLLCAGHCLSTSATTSTTREHDLERPILARLGLGLPVWMSRAAALAPASRARLSTRPACDSPPSSEGRQAASHIRTIDAVSRTVQVCREIEHRRPPLLVTPRARRRLESTVGCAEDGWGNGWVWTWVDSPGVKVPRPFRGLAARECREVPLLRDGSSTPWSSGGVITRKVGVPSARRTDLDPRFDFPREGERRRGNQDAFHFLGNPAHGWRFRARHVGRLSVVPSSRGPSRREVT